MAKVDIDLVKHVLQRHELDIRQISNILQDLQEENKAAENEDGERPPPVKKQFVMMVSDPEGVIKGKDLTGWVMQIPEEDSPLVAEERVVRAAYDFNQSPKGRRMPVGTIGEACEAVATKYFKEQNVWVKTKEPVLIIKTNNEIPRDKSS